MANVDNADVDKDTLRSRSTTRIIDIISEGPIRGLVDGDKSIFLDNSPIVTAGDNINYEGISTELRLGLPSQPSYSGFAAITTEFDLSLQEIQFNDPVSFVITDQQVSAVRVTVTFPRLYWAQKDGDVRKLSVPMKIMVIDNANVEYTPISPTIYGKCTSPYDVSWRVELSGRAPWVVSVHRLITHEEEVYEGVKEGTGQNGMKYWKSYAKSFTQIIDHKLSYPNTAMVSLAIDSELSGLSSVPQRTYEIYGLIIEVPSNYNPDTRTYSGIWNGTFKEAWTNNPAWVFRDIIINRRYGIGEFITDLSVDKWWLYAISVFCDELVPDGYGGSEPRFTCNVALTGAASAYSVIAMLASIFRGFPIWHGGQVIVRSDMPSDPVGIVTNSNVLNGSFVYEGSSVSARHTVAVVKYLRADRNWEEDVEIFEDPVAIERYGRRVRDVGAFATTTRGQAQRVARWLVYTDCYENELISWQAAWDHLFYVPGNNVLVSDTFQAGQRLSGRFKNVNGRSLVLDAPLDTSLQATISTTGADGGIETRSIVPGSTLTDEVYIATEFSSTVKPNAVWVINQQNAVQTRLVRILTMSEVDSSTLSIVAVTQDSDKYQRVERDLRFDDDAIYSSLKTTGPLPQPVNLQAIELSYMKDNRYVSAVDISWTAPSDPRAILYHLEAMYPDTGTWVTLTDSSSLTYRLFSPDPGLYQFRVRAIGPASNPSEWATSSLQVISHDRIPPNIEGFTADIQSEHVYLSWLLPPPASRVFISHYQIRFSASIDTNVPWEAAQPIQQRLPPTISSVTLSAQVGTYLIKAFNFYGIASVVAARTVVGTTFLPHQNLITTITEDIPWDGAKDRVVVAGSNIQLKMADGQSLFYDTGYYYADTAVDIGYNCAVARVSAEVLATGGNPNNVIATWGRLADIDVLDSSLGDGWSVTVEIAISYDNVLWTAFERLIVGDYTFRYAKFRLKLTTVDTANTTPVVFEWRTFIKMPDRVARAISLTSSAGAVSPVVFSPAFHAKPVFSVFPENTQVTPIVTALTYAAADIELKNLAGTRVAEAYSWFASGYGYRVSCPLRDDLGVPTLLDDIVEMFFNSTLLIDAVDNDLHMPPGFILKIIGGPVYGTAVVEDNKVRYTSPANEAVLTKLPLRKPSTEYTAQISNIIASTFILHPDAVGDVFDEVQYSIAGHETKVYATIRIRVKGV